MPKIRNIIIFVSIAAVFVLIYIFFVQKPETPETNLVTSSSSSTLPDVGGGSTTGTVDNPQNLVAQEFLTLLLSVRNIKLDDSIFADTAWSSLRDSSIVLVPDGTEGRPNPFAPIGSDSVSAPLSDPLTTPETSLSEEVPPEPTPPSSTKKVDHFNDTLSITSVTPLTGPVGTVVTINGFGFSQSGNRVSFDNADSRIQGLSSSDGTSISFTIPSSIIRYQKPKTIVPGVYSFWAGNNRGGSTATWQFTVTP